MFPLRIRAWLIMLSRVLVAIFLIVLAWYGWQVVTGPSNAFSHNIGVSSAWAKASIPIGAMLMIVMIIVQLAEDVVAIAGRDLSRFAAFGATGSPEI
jgi:TRAP-type C4-dicarboxylate transport system permease small subunit